MAWTGSNTARDSKVEDTIWKFSLRNWVKLFNSSRSFDEPQKFYQLVIKFHLFMHSRKTFRYAHCSRASSMPLPVFPTNHVCCWNNDCWRMKKERWFFLQNSLDGTKNFNENSHWNSGTHWNFSCSTILSEIPENEELCKCDSRIFGTGSARIISLGWPKFMPIRSKMQYLPEMRQKSSQLFTYF